MAKDVKMRYCGVVLYLLGELLKKCRISFVIVKVVINPVAKDVKMRYCGVVLCLLGKLLEECRVSLVVVKVVINPVTKDVENAKLDGLTVFLAEALKGHRTESLLHQFLLLRREIGV